MPFFRFNQFIYKSHFQSVEPVKHLITGDSLRNQCCIDTQYNTLKAAVYLSE